MSTLASNSDSPAALRGLANRYRQMAEREHDPRVRTQLSKVADDYQRRAVAG